MKNAAVRAMLNGKALSLVMILLSVACVPIEKVPQRSMGVSNGPDKVFEHPVWEVVPQLSGAQATGNNGRVGNELVFWEYQLADSRKVNLFACAMLGNVNCESRLSAICLASGNELSRTIVAGNVRHLDCQAVGIAGTGDLRPNCEDNEKVDELLVGLMQCQ